MLRWPVGGGDARAKLRRLFALASAARRFEGAVGLRLWVRPWERRSGAISVWREETDLRRFLGSPAHVAVMRKYRDRATATSESWSAGRFIAAEIEWQARRRLGRVR